MLGGGRGAAHEGFDSGEFVGEVLEFICNVMRFTLFECIELRAERLQLCV